MDGCLVPQDESSSLDVHHILRKLQSLGFCSYIKHNSDDSCFENILTVFLKELRFKMQIPPFPAMLGDGRPMELYKLYCIVSERGGYDSVTAMKSWAVVAEKIGLGSALGCPLKLVYAKYLNMLERCLQRVPMEKSDIGENLGILMDHSESVARGMFREILEQKKKDGTDFKLSPCSERVHLLTPVRKEEPMVPSDNCAHDRRNDSATSAPKLQNGSFYSLKRKRELLVGMLNWVRGLAKNPTDPSIGTFLPSDGLKLVKSMVGEQYSLALQARKALFIKRIRNVVIDASNSQDEQKKHPAIYDACNDIQTSRTHFLDHKSHSRSCLKSSMVYMGKKNMGPIDNSDGVNHLRRTSRNSTSLPDFLDDCVPQRIPIGSSFQAEVSNRTSNHPATSHDPNDLKWLGSRIWPPENQGNLPAEPSRIGKGREDGCGCRNPRSVECVRFHVAETRLQLKCKLGAAFYAWRFHFMGEEVALSWTEEEERTFREAFRLSQQSVGKNFWKQLHSSCLSKGHRCLVGYYFNVFLLALRSYQNRVSPNSIDSDGEETGIGFLSCISSYGAERFHELRPVICAQNSQCVDLGD